MSGERVTMQDALVFQRRRAMAAETARDEARRMATEAAEMLARIALVAERSTIRASLLCSADELAKRIAHRSLDEGWVTFDDVVDSDG